LTRVGWAILVCCAVAGCGYGLSSRTAKDIKSIAVPFFENRTSEPNLEILVTEQIIDNLIEDNTLSVVNEQDADALLEGKIMTFENLPFSFNKQLNAEEYLVVVTVRVSLYDRKRNTAIWEGQSIKGDGSYFLDSPSEGTFDDALDEALKEITDRILNLTVQDW